MVNGDPQGAKNPEGAWEFLQYIAGEEGQRVYSKDTSHLPTFESLGSEEGLLDERHAFFASLLPKPTAGRRSRWERCTGTS